MESIWNRIGELERDMQYTARVKWSGRCIGIIIICAVEGHGEVLMGWVDGVHEGVFATRG